MKRPRGEPAVETKSRQTIVFDPGGCRGRLRACPFLGGWRTSLCGQVRLDGGWYLRLERVYGSRSTCIALVIRSGCVRLGEGFPLLSAIARVKILLLKARA